MYVPIIKTKSYYKTSELKKETYFCGKIIKYYKDGSLKQVSHKKNNPFILKF